MSREVYKNDFGGEFRFNDLVEIYMTFEPKENCFGRLVQVRRKCGAWRSDQFFVQTANGLRCHENVAIKHVDVVAGLPDPHEPDCEYTIHEQYPETGFIIEKPSQPESYSPPFAITVTKP